MVLINILIGLIKQINRINSVTGFNFGMFFSAALSGLKFLEIYDPGVPLTLHPRLYTVALSGLSSQASISLFESTPLSRVFRMRRPWGDAHDPPVVATLQLVATRQNAFGVLRLTTLRTPCPLLRKRRGRYAVIIYGQHNNRRWLGSYIICIIQ